MMATEAEEEGMIMITRGLGTLFLVAMIVNYQHELSFNEEVFVCIFALLTTE